MTTDIETLGLPARIRNALTREGISSVEQLAEYTEHELFRIVDLGRLGIRDIRAALARQGMRSKPEIASLGIKVDAAKATAMAKRCQTPD